MALTWDEKRGMWINLARYPGTEEHQIAMAKNLLEHLLLKASRELADFQVARFWKIPEALQKTPCDFIGFTVTGRAILIEAKMVNKSSLPICGRPGLLSHQFTALSEANKAGCLSLLCWARGDVCATISFDMVLALSEGRQSVPWNRIHRRFHRRMTGDDVELHLLDHWLPAGAHLGGEL